MSIEHHKKNHQKKMTKTYFITGANRGIGLSIAKQLAADPDVEVIATARNPASATDLQELAKSNSRVKLVQLDVSDEDSIEKAGAEVAKLTDSIDVFISNGAIGRSYASVLETSKEQWVDHYNTNALGPVLLLKQIYPLIKKGTEKKIIFVSTMAASLGLTLPVNFSAYGQSKAALNYTVKDLSKELREDGSIVIAVHPGVVSTDMNKAAAQFMSERNPAAGELLALNERITSDKSAEDLLDLFEGLTEESNGKFFSYDKSEIPW